MDDKVINKGDLLSLVPKNKFDDSKLDVIDGLSDSEMQIIIKELFEWTKDINWPIAIPLMNILKKREQISIPCIKSILKSRDWEWTEWILKYLVSNFSDSYIMQLEKELETIVNIKDIDDDYEEMQIIARELYNRAKAKHS
ncbi:DUF5071 domain-containing protein [Butyrivibrio fibrisolvens]|uniref:DUF5071 domain-containing protein n=1 Tax=Butyrivibrio fibrisolvens TaxID=831 RepID=UPI0020BEBE24|nr:DUF5071 domain-containing protein [Butyrivibrio fibrisolvens]